MIFWGDGFGELVEFDVSGDGKSVAFERVNSGQDVFL